MPFQRDCSALAVVAALLAAAPAQAQRATDNAVASAEDAFGTSVGTESTGIYSEQDTRGFSPTKAGNLRIDGIYFDQVVTLSGRLKQSTSIRVGFAAEDYPFQAPTGIVDYRFRPMPTETGASVALMRNGFWASIGELDLRLPLAGGKVAITGGMAYAEQRSIDGTDSFSWGGSVRPIVRLGGIEFAPFFHRGWYPKNYTHPLTVVSGTELPELPRKRQYLGQRWARGRLANGAEGATLKAAITDALSLRGGLFRSTSTRLENYTEIFSYAGGGLATHRLIADPEQDIAATSGEVQLAWRIGEGRVQHRLIAGYRARERHTETGGSDLRNYGLVTYGERDERAEPVFSFGAVNDGRLRQSAFLLGYLGKIDGVAGINLGLQKARYRATFRDGRTGVLSRTEDDAWLYNATVRIDVAPGLSAFVATSRGLEDSGSAPENAANRNEQLPATRTTQYEAGLRWKFPQGQLAVQAFQITKPYFTFVDAAGTFGQAGSVRHRGVEASLAAHFGRRLRLVGGVVAMSPTVTGGLRAVGTPPLFAKVEANYRTDLLGGLTPTMTLNYTGRRAVSARAVAGGGQLFLPAYATVDLGLRHQFRIGKVPASFRALMSNVNGYRTWKVVAPNTLYPEESRRFSLSLNADF